MSLLGGGDQSEFVHFFMASQCFSYGRNRERLLKSLDSDGDGRIDLDEFRKLFNK